MTCRKCSEMYGEGVDLCNEVKPPKPKRRKLMARIAELEEMVEYGVAQCGSGNIRIAELNAHITQMAQELQHSNEEGDILVRQVREAEAAVKVFREQVAKMKDFCSPEICKHLGIV